MFSFSVRLRLTFVESVPSFLCLSNTLRSKTLNSPAPQRRVKSEMGRVKEDAKLTAEPSPPLKQRRVKSEMGRVKEDTKLTAESSPPLKQRRVKSEMGRVKEDAKLTAESSPPLMLSFVEV